jgi:hypothetical protein
MSNKLSTRALMSMALAMTQNTLGNAHTLAFTDPLSGAWNNSVPANTWPSNGAWSRGVRNAYGGIRSSVAADKRASKKAKNIKRFKNKKK